MQLVLALVFLGVGLTTGLNQFFTITLAFFWMGAFASATNDIASDGMYLIALKPDQQSFFVGLTWDEVGPGSAGIAMGTKTPTVEDTDEQFMYEAYYSYPINDGMTITPLIYSKDNVTSGADDTTGVMVKTSFSF